MKTLRILFATMFILYLPTAWSQDAVEGYWKSVNEDSGEVTGIWKLYIKDNTLFGQIVDYPDAKPEDVCDQCNGSEFHNKPIIGTPWIKLTQKTKGKWKKGYIIDSRDGEKYDARVWVDDNKLMVRGYVGFFYRTQEWLPATLSDVSLIKSNSQVAPQ